MFNSMLSVPAPVTVRRIGMLGGGASGSKGRLEPKRGNHLHSVYGRSSLASRSNTAASVSNAAPSAARSQLSDASPSVATLNELRSGSMTMATPTTVSTPPAESPALANPPSIIILTALDDGEDASVNEARSWRRSTQEPSTVYRDPTSGVTRDVRGLGPHQPSALVQTETTLSPLYYSSACCQPDGVGTGTSSPFLDRTAAGTNSSSTRQSPERSGEERFFNGSPHPESYGLAVAWNSLNAAASVPTPRGPLQQLGSSWRAGGATPPDQQPLHPVRISATPVVPIVPHVSEPWSRRRMAEDLERLYGLNSRQTAAEAARTSSSEAANGAASPPATAAAAAVGGHNAAARVPALQQEAPKTKIGAFSFLPSSSSSKKAAKAAVAAEAKKKAALLTAAERRQAREQVIRVGVQRLYQRLNELRLVVHHIKNDGNCQFRAISHQLFGNEDYHDIIRSQVVSYMRAARAECFDFYFESPAQADVYYDNLAKPGSWGDELSLRAASDCLYVNIHVLSSEERHCYITYRPSIDHAAYAPSFLIDVAKLRERRKAMRQRLRSHGLHGGTSPATMSFDSASPCVGTTQMSRGGDLNASASATPYLQSCERSGFNSTMAKAHTPSTAPTLLMPGNGGATARCAPPLQPQLFPPSPLPMSRYPSEFFMDDDDTDDDAEVDANAIQLALHKKLQRSEIHCSLPQGSAANPFSFGTITASHGVSPNAAPLLQPQRAMQGSYVAPQLLRPMDAPVPLPWLVSHSEGVAQGAKMDQMERFRAVGAEVQPLGDATQAVNIFTQRMESMPTSATENTNGDSGIADYVRVRRTPSGMKVETPPPSMLQPQTTSFAEASSNNISDNSTTDFPCNRSEAFLTASNLPYTSPLPPRSLEKPREMLLLASSVHRGRANPMTQPSCPSMLTANSYGGSAKGDSGVYPGSFNANPTQRSCSQSFTGAVGGGSYPQPNGSMASAAACEGESLANVGAGQPHGDAGEAPVSILKFEPRTEAIDIFLSYLYPVHYNSLSVSQQQQSPSVNTSMTSSTVSPAIIERHDVAVRAGSLCSSTVAAGEHGG
ncbi:hypothetical protein ABL78_5396 [Leptomonas seymouri]|uniref:OTU domain-containing protein n=1 Tax=Leptomonas seymouri TaxID=5684 RepID=A0A0N0P538_LEPSE|nr:hypothetical protein ABL78_5396 [Leptomonas seymouri]|eukprot:KPI85547.1 hypothetical protein ABL78_5396 [Leptomonas seymouri]